MEIIIQIFGEFGKYLIASIVICKLILIPLQIRDARKLTQWEE